MVNLWFRKSREDLQAAKLLLAQMSDELYGPVVFHAQQSAEKALKGFLTFQKIRFSKTHDLKVLINLVTTINKELAKDLSAVQILTLYAVAYRYPNEVEPPEPLTQKSCEKVLALAENTFKLLSNLVNKV